MQFSINGWSPVATHLICLFLGLALANISYEPCLEATISPYKVLIPLKNDQFIKISVNRVYSGQKMMLVKYNKKKFKIDCLETEVPGKIRHHNNSYFVEVSKSSSTRYLNSLVNLKQKFYLIPYEKALLYSLCKKSPEVSYGSL